MLEAKNRIYNENCLETMSRMQDGVIDCVVTSPPYDDLRQYNGYSFDFENVAQQLYRVMADNSTLVWVVGDATKDGSETGTSFKQALYFMSLGFKLHDTMIYEKNSSSFPARPSSNRYTQIFEYMFVFTKGKPEARLICDKRNAEAGKRYGVRQTFGGKEYTVPEFSPRTNIWKFTTSLESSKIHPAMFPRELARDHILSWSKEGDVVYDPFSGSGTTCLEAKLNNRVFVGSEVSEDYWVKSLERINGNTEIL